MNITLSRGMAVSISSMTLAASRELSEVEEFAVAKMSLFQAFDERNSPADLRHPVDPTRENFKEILTTLDLL